MRKDQIVVTRELRSPKVSFQLHGQRLGEWDGAAQPP
jgi:hypothetical protein